MYENEINEISQFSSMINNSFFLLSYSIFERYLFDICSFCEKEEDKRVGAKDIKGNGNIDQCRKYLIKIIEVDLTRIELKWSKIKMYQTIRNSIAHNGGNLSEIDKNLKSFIENDESIFLNETSKSIHIKSIHFIMEFSKLISEFISIILSEIYKQKTA